MEKSFLYKQELEAAYGFLGEAAASLHFAGYDNLAERVKRIEEEVYEFI